MSDTNITAEGARFIENAATKDLSDEALRIGRRCIVDTLGLYLAGGLEPTVKILAEDAAETGGKAEAYLLTAGKAKVPAALAARVLGTAGHAHDWDDTQVSHDPASAFAALPAPSDTTTTRTSSPSLSANVLTTWASWQGAPNLACDVPMADAAATLQPRSSLIPLSPSRRGWSGSREERPRRPATATPNPASWTATRTGRGSGGPSA